MSWTPTGIEPMEQEREPVMDYWWELRKPAGLK